MVSFLPEDLQAVRDDREGLIRSTVEEIARFETPARFLARKALEDMEYDGVRIQAGQNVLVCLGAANRDPARFPTPIASISGVQTTRISPLAPGRTFASGQTLPEP
jgi:cytochrome P450